MKLEFRTHNLSTASINLSEATRLFGVQIGRKYVQRLAVLRATDNFSHLYGHRALKLHSLKGDRAEQYAVSLTENYRLIIEKIEEDHIRIINVEDSHGN